MATYQRGPSFYTKFVVQGTPYISTFATQEEGEAWEAETRLALKLGKPLPVANDFGTTKAHKVQTIQDLVEHVNQVRWCHMKSAKNAKQKADLFAEWCGPNLPAGQALTSAKAHEYVLFRQTEKRNVAGTINRHLATVSVLHKAAKALKIVMDDIDLPWRVESQGRLRFYSPEEETAILGLLVQWEMPEWADFFMVLLDTGARLEEVETYGSVDPETDMPRPKLLWGDIRDTVTKDGVLTSITFEDTKTKLPRTVYATERVQEVFKRMKARDDTPHGPFEWVSRRRLRTIWDNLRAELKWMGPDTVVHTFRHTCASRLVQRGVDIYRVMKWMGHKDIATTQRYAKLRPTDMEELARVLAAHTEKGNAVPANL